MRQGALDGGLDVPHSDKRFVGYSAEDKALDAETLRKYIYGGHVSEYMENLQARVLCEASLCSFESRWAVSLMTYPPEAGTCWWTVTGSSNEVYVEVMERACTQHGSSRWLQAG